MTVNGGQKIAAPKYGKHAQIYKILVIGDACVGKTSFVQRYVKGTFSKAYRGTIGVDFALKVVPSPTAGAELLKVQLWDIAGQERFSYMTRVYYRDAHGCIIMFDLTNRSSFLNVAKWKRDFDVKCVSPTGDVLPCMLVANKVDDSSARQVSPEEVERMSHELRFTKWTEISVRNNLMVEETMAWLMEAIEEEKARLLAPKDLADCTGNCLQLKNETEKKFSCMHCKT